MNDVRLHYLSIDEAAALIRSRQLSAEELCVYTLDRIAALDGQLNSYLSVLNETARAAAKQADRELAAGLDRGPLHGIPVAVKDLIFAKDGPTTAGTAIHRDFRAGYDATVVAQLRNHGAILLGKLHLSEAGGMLHHPEYPVPLNPYRDDLWTGVSSSGSGVATAAGLCFASLGSDTGGSIRFPSACNGLTGLRPTWGRVSRHGIFHLSESCDTLGPIARSAADVAHVLTAIAGPDPRDPTSLDAPVPSYAAELGGADGARGLRVGVDWTYVEDGATEDTLARLGEVARFLEELGATIVEIEMPKTETLCLQIADIHMAELAHAHKTTYPAEADRYGDWLRRGLEKGVAVDPVRLAESGIALNRFKGQLARIMSDVDIILLPVFAHGTPTRAEAERLAVETPEAMFRFTIPSGAAGVPCLTIPGDVGQDGIPWGFQLIGRHCEEGLLLRAGHAVQLASGWHHRHPTVG